jgi:hypothetical protein
VIKPPTSGCTAFFAFAVFFVALAFFEFAVSVLVVVSYGLIVVLLCVECSEDGTFITPARKECEAKERGKRWMQKGLDDSTRNEVGLSGGRQSNTDNRSAVSQPHLRVPVQACASVDR